MYKLILLLDFIMIVLACWRLFVKYGLEDWKIRGAKNVLGIWMGAFFSLQSVGAIEGIKLVLSVCV